MKRCPTCNRVETDETLNFCRADGAVLVEDTSVSDEFSATRILTSSPTGEAQGVHSESGHAQVITSGLEPAKEPRVQTGQLRSPRNVGPDSFITRIKRHKTSAIVIAAGDLARNIRAPAHKAERRRTATVDQT
jgi:hypothetical protein